MASKDYLPLFWAARKAHLGNIAQTSEEIAALYREAAADLAARAAASRKGSLSQRWAEEYSQSLKRRVAELESGLYDVTLQGLKRSAELPSAAMGQWWEMVGGQSFRDAFALPPDNILAGIIDGSFYKDKKGLSERIWGVANRFETDIGYIVNRGIAEKKSALELAHDLEQYVKPPAKRDFDWGKVYPDLSGRKVDFNAQRLARTSINHSYFLDNVRVCTENPFVESMHWDLSNAHDERQVIPFGPDECDEYAEHDEGLGLGNFKPEEIPVPHPQCLCVQYAVIPQSLEDIGAQIGRWASGEPDAVLDEWYDKYGNQNPNGDPKEILREGLKFEGNGGIIKTESNAHKRNPELEAVIRRCIQQDKPVFADGLLAQYFERIPHEYGKYITSMHGTAHSVELYGYEVSAAILANVLRSRSDFHNENVILIACNTGNTDTDSNCFAQQLADEMKVIVYAPTRYGAINARGEYYSSDLSGINHEGVFLPFAPRRDET